ncbi:SMC-Scp complex subunit ScpB [Halothiobacillus sp. DCM-1]|uniref:SMC-Scp complex subunit ScpB n=1 Tax=Halothiobacillus sp. DCM-1 TaxID=3112558 RepID=UPI00324544EB
MSRPDVREFPALAAQREALAASPSELVGLIEALLLAEGAPLSRARLQHMLGEAIPASALEQALAALVQRYADHPYIDCLPRMMAGEETWSLVANAAVAPYLARAQAPRTARYSRAVLETLALIAWRQPITRGEIEAVRGVAVNPQIIRQLMDRGWIRSVGVRETPGRPELLATTDEFLRDFNLPDLSALPTLDAFGTQGELVV